MENFVIKTYNANSICELPKFYVLCKGLNSGKPLFEPCPNSFVIICTSEELKLQLYWLCYSLWKLKSFHPHLIGSFIPFIRIKEFRTILENYFTYSENKSPGKVLRITKQLNDISLLEEGLKRKLYLVQELRDSVLKEYLRR